MPGLTQSQGKSGLKNCNPMEYTINIKGRLMDLSTPQVMGILNVTPDSFYSGSRKQTEMEIAQRANQIIEEGGSIIDVGAFSTRPGADEVSEEEEGRRLKFALDIVRREQPDAAISVDTYRPTLARKCIESGELTSSTMSQKVESLVSPMCRWSRDRRNILKCSGWWAN